MNADVMSTAAFALEHEDGLRYIEETDNAEALTNGGYSFPGDADTADNADNANDPD